MILHHLLCQAASCLTLFCSLPNTLDLNFPFYFIQNHQRENGWYIPWIEKVMGLLQKYQETVISLLPKVHPLYRSISWSLQSQRGSSEKNGRAKQVYISNTFIYHWTNPDACEKIQVFAWTGTSGFGQHRFFENTRGIESLGKLGSSPLKSVITAIQKQLRHASLVTTDILMTQHSIKKNIKKSAKYYQARWQK